MKHEFFDDCTCGPEGAETPEVTLESLQQARNTILLAREICILNSTADEVEICQELERRIETLKQKTAVEMLVERDWLGKQRVRIQFTGRVCRTTPQDFAVVLLRMALRDQLKKEESISRLLGVLRSIRL